MSLVLTTPSNDESLEVRGGRDEIQSGLPDPVKESEAAANLWNQGAVVTMCELGSLVQYRKVAS